MTRIEVKKMAGSFPHQLDGKLNVQQHFPNQHFTTNLDKTIKGQTQNLLSHRPRLLLYSASDARGTYRQSKLDSQYLASIAAKENTKLHDDFAYTRNCRRSCLAWKSYAVTSSASDYETLQDHISQAERSTNDKRNLGFVFTGQGAQWVGMGKEFEEILKGDCMDTRIDDPAYSQSLTTILQIALVDLLHSVGLSPYTVIGHSSGEIAAAYTAGHLSHHSAIAVAYYRGQLSSKLIETSTYRHSMMVIGLSADATRRLALKIQLEGNFPGFDADSITISCVNSPNSVTVSAPDAQLQLLAAGLKRMGVFHRKLRVGLGYHSPQMGAIAQEYRTRLGVLEQGVPKPKSPVMVSSVTNKVLTADDACQAQYWVDNMVSPVEFSNAIAGSCTALGSDNEVTKLDLAHKKQLHTHGFLEIGPHSTLRAPVEETMSLILQAKEIVYTSALVRKSSATKTFLQALGKLFCAGFKIDLDRITGLSTDSDKPPSLLTSLPPYSFDHSVKHWEESRTNTEFRFQKHPPHDLLGSQIDYNPLETKWRLIIREVELPWISDHKVNGAIAFPAAGMLVMVIEATKRHLHERLPLALELENVEFIAPVVITPELANGGVELHITLASTRSAEGRTDTEFKFRIFMIKAKGTWEEVCRGSVRGDSGKVPSDVDHGRETFKKLDSIIAAFDRVSEHDGFKIPKDRFYESIAKNLEIEYGPAFQPLEDISVPVAGEAVASLQPYITPCSSHVIHPTTLDGVFQLSFAALDTTQSSKFPTMVPSRLGRLWISMEGAGHDETSVTERIHAQANILSSRTIVTSSVVFGGPKKDVKVHVEELELMAVSSPAESKTLDDAEHISHFLSWNVDLDRLTSKEIKDYLEEARDMTSEPKEWSVHMDLMLFSFAAISFKEIEDSQRPITPKLQNYAIWLQERLDEFLQASEVREDILSVLHDKEHLRSLYDKVLPTAVAELYILVGENLTQMLLGDIDPLGLLFEDERLMVDFYTDLIHRSTAIGPMSRYLDALVHKWPDLDFLEVGAGTGASSAMFLDIMDNEESGTRFESYTFTDISPSFFEKAQTRLRAHEERVTYKVLDLEEDIAVQGFLGNQYDVIIADNVLHATANLNVSLQNLKRLLKPGGKLFIKEMTTGMKVITGYFSGLLPGWWKAVEDDRIAQRSPVLSEPQWDDLLKYSGFSGTELILRDFADARCYCWSFMVATFPDTKLNHMSTLNGTAALQSPLIIFDRTSQLQRQVAQAISQDLDVPQTNFCSPNDILDKVWPSKQTYIILNSLDEFLFWDLSSSFLRAMQHMISNASKVLWVTGGGGIAPMSPKSGIANGLLRVIRQENNHVDLISVSLDVSLSQEPLSPASLRHISNLFLAEDVETEYNEINERLCISRLVTARKIDKHVFSQLEHPVSMHAIGNKALKLQVKVPGLLDTMEFREVIEPELLGPDEVVIEVKALGVNFKDCLTMLGRVNSDIMGSECSGVILHAGSNTDFFVGDRVVAGALDSYRTILRTGKEMVVKLPDEMSFVEAASFPTAFCTALYSLIYVARLQKDESVLIHAASGGTGQAAVQIALRAGAEVFATVGSLPKKTLLIEQYGIAEDHIFYSRDSSFADGVMRLTKGHGINVVLNSVSGKLLESTWNVVAPFGRFVEIGRKDVDTRGHLSMYPFIKNLSFSGVDLTMVLEKNVQLGKRLLTEVMELSKLQEIQPIYPIQPYKVIDAEKAFRFMQSGNSSGKIVLEIDRSHVVPIIRAGTPEYLFSENASYVVAGGLGGIGRRIASWLVERGARHLILLSRSGGEGNKRAAQLVQDLHAAGVEVRTPKCDIANITSLQHTLDTCTDMPPIRGCFHAAMTISDNTFDKLTIENWRECTMSKIQGSWNLHSLLPSGLDFFVMLSSACGIFGNAGQGSYAAGNTFLDALSRYRVSVGEKATALDLGILLGEGYVAEAEHVMAKLMRLNLLAPMALDKLFAIFDYYCNPNVEISVRESQICTGFELPVDAKRRGRDVHTTMLTPLFRHMHQIQSFDQLRLKSQTQTKNFRNLFIEAATADEAKDLATEALKIKMSRILGLPISDIALDSGLDSYGVDSLVALELRNWMTKEMSADIAVFELLGGTTIRDIGGIIATKSALRA
ncbi:hypothetical protein N0V90_001723 [Kalmusia sp. IMI 367209]|nr:hypothetical protein N0V90_001723 [Kalmusia sp. IMI 367209]